AVSCVGASAVSCINASSLGGHGYLSSSHARASVNGRPASTPAPVITIEKVRRVSIEPLPSPRGEWAYSGPSQWRHIDANGALFAQSGVGKVTVPRISLLPHRC